MPGYYQAVPPGQNGAAASTNVVAITLRTENRCVRRRKKSLTGSVPSGIKVITNCSETGRVKTLSDTSSGVGRYCRPVET
jgi:hypothetical protein